MSRVGADRPWVEERRPNRLVRALIILGGIASAAVAAGFVFLLLSGMLRFAPASNPAPTDRAAAIATPGASATTAPTDTPTTEQPASPSSIASGEGSAVVDRFVSLVSKGNLSFHADEVANVDLGKESGTLRGSTDQSGADLRSSIEVHSPTNNLALDVIVKDGVAYAKKKGTGWLSGDMSSATTTTTFPKLASGTIEYLGTDRKAGKTLHHLRVPILPNQNPNAQSVVEACAITSLPMEFWVRADGTPVSAYIEFSCIYQGQKMGFTDRYVFTKFGDPIDIKAPAHYTTTTPSGSATT